MTHRSALGGPGLDAKELLEPGQLKKLDAANAKEATADRRGARTYKQCQSHLNDIPLFGMKTAQAPHRATTR